MFRTMRAVAVQAEDSSGGTPFTAYAWANSSEVIVGYPHLHGYLLDLYQQPCITDTVNLNPSKRHYDYTHADINPTALSPSAPHWTSPARMAASGYWRMADQIGGTIPSPCACCLRQAD